MPILNKVKVGHVNNVLALEDYTVNSGQIEALASVLHLFSSNSINSLYFNNNGIRDADFEALFNGIKRNPFIRSLEIDYN